MNIQKYVIDKHFKYMQYHDMSHYQWYVKWIYKYILKTYKSIFIMILITDYIDYMTNEEFNFYWLHVPKLVTCFSSSIRGNRNVSFLRIIIPSTMLLMCVIVVSKRSLTVVVLHYLMRYRHGKSAFQISRNQGIWIEHELCSMQCFRSFS